MDATTGLLAEILHVDAGDVRVLLDTMGAPPGDVVAPAYLDDLHQILNPWAIRTVPEIWSGTSGPEAQRERRLVATQVPRPR